MVTTDAKGTSAAGHPAEPEVTPPPAGDGSQPAVETRRAAGGSRTTTIRLPLISATFTRPSRPDSPQQPPASPTSSSGAPAAADPATTGAHSVGGVSLSRAAFYAGAVALGALEVVEWPVTLLVVAGTYLADQVRGSAAPAATPGGSGSSSAPAGPVLPAAAPPLHAGD